MMEQHRLKLICALKVHLPRCRIPITFITNYDTSFFISSSKRISRHTFKRDGDLTERHRLATWSFE
jgi:hypothetical protein